MVRKSDDQAIVELSGEVIAAMERLLSEEIAAERALAGFLGINPTDARCLNLVLSVGVVDAATVAAHTGLTRAGVTTVLDRLERAGYLERHADEVDRRRVAARPTEKARRAVALVRRPLEAERTDRLRSARPAQLRIVRDFLLDMAEIQRRHAVRIADARGGTRTHTPSKG